MLGVEDLVMLLLATFRPALSLVDVCTTPSSAFVGAQGRPKFDVKSDGTTQSIYVGRTPSLDRKIRKQFCTRLANSSPQYAGKESILCHLRVELICKLHVLFDGYGFRHNPYRRQQQGVFNIACTIPKLANKMAKSLI